MNTQQSIILSLTLSILSLIGVGLLFFNIKGLNRLRKKFFAGNTGADLEDVINALSNETKDMRSDQAVLHQALSLLKEKSSFSLQKFGLVRFNPFSDGGGNFSFCLALLDAHDSGIIITSMYGREQNRIYSKKVLNGKCESQLTEEEQMAIAQAGSK